MTERSRRLTGWFCSLCLLLLFLSLPGCSDNGSAPGIPAQHWGDAEIDVQTRPMEVRPGMVEFLIIATTERGLPVHDMVVSVRMDKADPWSQTIQDGHSGVYRRAIWVAAGQDTLYLQLRRGKEIDVLEFSLRPVLPAAATG